MSARANLTLAAWIVATSICAQPALAAQRPSPTRLTPAEISALPKGGAGVGTSGVEGIRTIVLSGDPSAAGPYVIELVAPANTRIAAHHHRDDRFAVVVSGEWYFGYGSQADAEATKPLPPGSVYTEPGGTPHFAMTRAEPATVVIVGVGPTDTVYEVMKDDPRARQ
jgi:uncharacterized RmlC-like cupin family protein